MVNPVHKVITYHIRSVSDEITEVSFMITKATETNRILKDIFSKAVKILHWKCGWKCADG